MNQEVYFAEKPPRIPTENIEGPPVIMYAGAQDKQLVMKDALKAKELVKTTQEFIEVDSDHSGFHFIKEKSFYDSVIEKLDTYWNYSSEED